MKRSYTAILLGMVVTCLCYYPILSQDSINGDWIGEINISENCKRIKVHFKQEQDSLLGTLDFSLFGGKNKSLDNIHVKGSHVHFELTMEQQTLHFDGEVKGGTISGDFKQGTQPGTFKLVRLANVNPKMYEEYIGDYEVSPGTYISIFKLTGVTGEVEFSFVDFESGRFGNLYPLSETRFLSEASFNNLFPMDPQITFIKEESKVKGLAIKQAGKPGKILPRVNLYSKKEVTFANGEITLSGNLMIPIGKGPHAAVVLVHGSGPGNRHQLVIPAHFFLHQGLAVLTYDKRGCGTSSGDWRRADFAELASDALAGVKFLKNHKSINPQKIGLYGISQGGWIVPLAASLSRDVSFIIPHSGPGVSPGEQELYRMKNWLTSYGIAKAEVSEIINAFELLFNFIRSGKGGEKLDAAVNNLRKNPVLARMAPPLVHEMRQWEDLYKKQPIGDPGWFLHLNFDFDPLPVYRKVSCPVLAIFGKFDSSIPVEESAARIEKALKDGGNQDYTIKVFPNAGHGIIEMKGSGPMDFVSPLRIFPGFFETITNWLKKRGS